MLHPRIKGVLLTVVGVTVGNIVVFSPGLLGLSFTGGAFSAAISAAVLVGSIGLLFIKLKPLILPQYDDTPPIDVDNLKSHKDYMTAIEVFKFSNAFSREYKAVVSHLHQMDSRRTALLDILNDRFDPTELTYKRFHTTFLSVEKLFYANIKSILSKLKMLGSNATYAGYDSEMSSPEVIKQRESIRLEYRENIKKFVSFNEEILLKLDRLILEISNLGVTDLSSIENLACLRDIDSLINHTKLYKE